VTVRESVGGPLKDKHVCVEVSETQQQTSTPDTVQLRSFISLAFLGDRIDKMCIVRAM